MNQAAHRIVTVVCLVSLIVTGHAEPRTVRQDAEISPFVRLPIAELTSEKWSTEFKSLSPEFKSETISEVQSQRRIDRREALVHLIGLLLREVPTTKLNEKLAIECVFQADERVIEAFLKAGAIPTEDCFQLICLNKEGGYRALVTLAKELNISYAITSPSSDLVQYAALMHNLDVLKLMIQLGGDPFKRRDISVVGGCLGSVLRGVDAAEAAAYLEHAEVDDADEVLEFLIQKYSADPRFPSRQKLLTIARNRKSDLSDEGWRTRDTYEYFLEWLSKVPFHSQKGAGVNRT